MMPVIEIYSQYLRHEAHHIVTYDGKKSNGEKTKIN